MLSAPKPDNEKERLDALWSYELLDTDPESAFDAMTKLAADLCDAPMALVSLIDDERQWFKSKCGFDSDVDSTGRDIAFCAHAILQHDIFEIPDTRADPRFADNPLVKREPFIRFYAGAPLIARGGVALGTLCVLDHEPRLLTLAQRLNLQRIAQAVVGLITMRTHRSEADERRVALLGTSLAQSKERSEQLKALKRLGETLETVHTPDDIIALALTAALRLCGKSNGAIVPADTATVVPASTAVEPLVASAQIRTRSAAGPKIVLTRSGASPYTPSDRMMLELIATMAGLALAGAGSPA